MSRGCDDEPVDLTWWPERPEAPTAGDLQQRAQAWDRTGYGFRP